MPYAYSCFRHRSSRTSLFQTTHDVTEVRLLNSSSYNAKQRGYGGQTKPVFRKKAKTTKKIALKLECAKCKVGHTTFFATLRGGGGPHGRVARKRDEGFGGLVSACIEWCHLDFHTVMMMRRSATGSERVQSQVLHLHTMELCIFCVLFIFMFSTRVNIAQHAHPYLININRTNLLLNPSTNAASRSSAPSTSSSVGTPRRRAMPSPSVASTVKLLRTCV